MGNKYCIYCGAIASLRARYCADCGYRFSIDYYSPIKKILRVFYAAMLLTVYGAFVALMSGIIGCCSAYFLISSHGVWSSDATLLIISFSSIASFGFSAPGIILTAKRKNAGFH